MEKIKVVIENKQKAVKIPVSYTHLIELVERTVEETIENGEYVLIAHDRCREDICREEPILISENGG